MTTGQVVHLLQEFRRICRAEGRVTNGCPWADVQGQVVHVARSAIDDPTSRVRLGLIPTGPTVPAGDMDALVQDGEQLVRAHPAVRAPATARR